MKKLFPLLMCLFLSVGAFSQTFEVPEDYKLVAKEDYAPYEKDIIAASKWLVATPLKEHEYKRKEVLRFVVSWVMGSPTVTCDITAIVMDFDKKNAGMLGIYMAGVSRYVLEHNYSKDSKANARAGLIDVLTVYKNNADVKKDKKMEKLIKAYDDGNIDDWMLENFK
jgi:hypothetical protein